TEADREVFTEEELRQGFRLSCRIDVSEDLVVEIPHWAKGKAKEATAKAELDKQIVNVKPDCLIERRYLELNPPGRGDQRADAQRIVDEVGSDYRFYLDGLADLPSEVRDADYELTATLDTKDKRVLSVDPGDKQYELYGMAFDIGTTTVAGYGMDLETGRTLNVNSQENPQGQFGADVVTRIKYVRENEGGLERIQEVVIEAANKLVDQFIEEEKIERKDIFKATFVGNTIMLHLLTGVDPTHLDQSPYIPSFTRSQSFRAKELGININPGGKVTLLPSLAGYIGADIMAGILQTEMHKTDELSLLVDIGTNGEMVLGNKDRLYAASTAAGPAFEGANIEQGMTARSGAISHVDIDEDGQLKIEVINDKQPIGLCGSGIVDAVGELLNANLIESKGNITSGKEKLPRPTINPLGNRMIDMDGQKAFWLHIDTNPVFITQRDVREVQLAKGAIKAGIDILLEEYGADQEEIDKVYLAGAFGNYLRKENIMRLGVLPNIAIDKVISVGNTAGQGAKLALFNKGKMEEVEEITKNVEYIELSFREDFSDKFMKEMRFPDPDTLKM
ncbi:DUF4445 domain-containing protein, partial [Candidatus Bipolaricaulota bacterium]|nr:DUF4445 domain-containing protein [Candidatus Bipolaricaulota bacterium]